MLEYIPYSIFQSLLGIHASWRPRGEKIEAISSFFFSSWSEMLFVNWSVCCNLENESFICINIMGARCKIWSRRLGKREERSHKNLRDLA